MFYIGSSVHSGYIWFRFAQPTCKYSMSMTSKHSERIFYELLSPCAKWAHSWGPPNPKRKTNGSCFLLLKKQTNKFICPITHPPTGSHLIMTTLLVYFLMVDNFRLMAILMWDTVYVGILSVSSKPPSDRFGFFFPEKPDSRAQIHVSKWVQRCLASGLRRSLTEWEVMRAALASDSGEAGTDSGS